MADSNRRLSNTKTKDQTGLEYVLQSINIITPFGQKLMKEQKPFFPGEEESLRRELDKIEKMLNVLSADEKTVNMLLQNFMEMKEIGYTLARSGKNALSVVELYEIKSMLLKMRTQRNLCEKTELEIPQEYILEDTEDILDILDPGKDRLNTFYIYDEFSPQLSELRKQKRELELQIRRRKKSQKEYIKENYGVLLTPKFDLAVSKSDQSALAKVREIPQLIQIEEDYMSVTFELKDSEEVFALVKEEEKLNERIDEEELLIRERLSKEISNNAELLSENCRRLGKLDIALAKAIYAKKHDCVRPEIAEEHIIKIEEGRHLQVEDILCAKGKEYCPVSISLKDGVTCITGANMGGKTVSLRLSGLVPMMAQYGLFVPCKKARIGLSNYMQILIGDSQSLERGLSSFGSEMEELKEILDNSKERSLLLIDEIASGTNPVEGMALTKSIVDFLKQKPYITLITTHFDSVTEDSEVKNMQVVGLAGADFDKLNSELRYANRKERINIISKYMDYRLYAVNENNEIPKDALNIARMLGIPTEIIENAKSYIK